MSPRWFRGWFSGCGRWGCGLTTDNFPQSDWMECFNEGTIVVLEVRVCAKVWWYPHHVIQDVALLEKLEHLGTLHSVWACVCVCVGGLEGLIHNIKIVRNSKCTSFVLLFI